MNRPGFPPALIAGALTLAIPLLPACGADRPADTGERAESASTEERNAHLADALGSGDASLPEPDLERGRLDPSWRDHVEMDGAPGDTAAAATTEEWTDISARSLNTRDVALPLHGDVAGPSVAKVQVMLDRALFSPGIIDGRWGKNTEKAVYWFQSRHGLDRTGRVDRATLQRLIEAADSPTDIATEHGLTSEDVKGPFVSLPEDTYARAGMQCLCYESLAEKLAERFHTTTGLLEQLNPDVALNELTAGQTILVPNVRDTGIRPAGSVARIVISDGGHYLHALEADGTILYHFPSTLGSDYAPSPQDDDSVTSIAWDPSWHYQPELLSGEDPSRDDAVLPPGPNNAVGIVWMQLSRPHYGIHGTAAPETIGYATSHGCVRLTNWDARTLGERITEGTPVQFRDDAGRGSR